MSVVRVITKSVGWEGEAEAVRNNLLYETVARRYRVIKWVYTNTPHDGPETIIASLLVPQVGSAYNLFNDSDALATCVRVSPKQTAFPLLWELECVYDTARIVSAITDNPLLQPPEIRWGSIKVERPLVRDVTGVPVLNSSKEVFNPALTFEETRPLLTIIRNEATFNKADALFYQDAINEDVFATAAPLKAKINSIDGVSQLTNGVVYWQVTYQIEFRREGFAYLVLDQGFRDIDKKLFRDPIDFAPLSSETLLNGRGRPLRDSVAMLTDAMNATDPFINFNDPFRFPPGSEKLINGWMPSGDYYFDVLVGSEIITVTQAKPIASSFPPWTCLRAQRNTVAAAHAVGAEVRLEPYFKRFLPYKVLPFSDLNLPAV